MLLTSNRPQEETLEAREPRVVSNTVIKMPWSISPFLMPLAPYPPEIEDTLEDNPSSDLSRYTIPHSFAFKLPLPGSDDIKVSSYCQISHKRQSNTYRSKTKTLIRIIKSGKSILGSSRQQRKYFVEFRYGNEAKTFIKKMDEKTILEKDPNLLIDLLLATRNSKQN